MFGLRRVNDCLSLETLREMIEGRSPAERTRTIVDHIAICAACRTLADEISDDARLRELFARSTRIFAEEPPALGELKAKLYALGEESPRRFEHGEADETSNEAPKILGRYQLHEVLGAGGFAVVYKAEDIQLRRPVALKLPKAEALADADGRRRFLREARVAAGLHHPHIVALYDAGEVDGVWYLASALTDGPTLAQWATQLGRPAPVEQVLCIAMALATAVEHAHEHGVLHRDIKPQNVLLDPAIDFRGLGFSPQLTDFGVAKLLTVEVEQTIAGQMFGTPRYMAPELVSGKPDAASPASDIYALGVVLYELLTARSPIGGVGHAEVLRRVVTEEPKPLRKLRPEISRDVEAVCLTCLEKDPQRRYASAGDLAAELERCLEQRPTIARPIGAFERARRWAKRRPAAASLIGVVATAILLAVAGLFVHSQRLDGKNRQLTKALGEAKAARSRAAISNEEMRQLAYVTDMRLAAQAWREGDLRTLNELLDRQRPQRDMPDRRGMEWRFLKQFSRFEARALADFPSEMYYLAFDPAHNRLAVAGKDGAIRVLDAASGRLEKSIASKQGEVNCVRFSSDGRKLVSAGDDGALRIWKLDDWSLSSAIEAHKSLAYQASFTHDDASLVSCGVDRSIRMWSAADGKPLAILSGHHDNVEALRTLPSSDILASAGLDGTVRLWSLTTGIEERGWTAPGYVRLGMLCVAVSSDGKLVAAGGYNRTVWLWSRESGKLLASGRHLDVIHSLEFSPDNARLVAGDAGGAVCVWQWEPAAASKPNGESQEKELRCLRKWLAHDGTVTSMVFTENERLATTGADGAVRVWEMPRADTPFETRLYSEGLKALAFPAEKRLLALQHFHTLLDWRPNDDPQLLSPVSVSCDWRHLVSDRRHRIHATRAESGRIDVWDSSALHEGTALGKRIATIALANGYSPKEIALAGDGSQLFVEQVGPRHELLVYSTRTKKVEASLHLTMSGSTGCGALSTNGRLAIRLDDDLLLWTFAPSGAEQETGENSLDRQENLRRLKRVHRLPTCLAFSPDDSLLASGGGDRKIKLWNPATGELLVTLSGHRGGVQSLVFSNDGRTLLSAGADGKIKAWNVAARKELFDLLDDGYTTEALAISPDGRWLGAIRDSGFRLFLLDLGAGDAAL